ncbi:MAG: HFX_2341 family transcriptional regulator domain-containing protein, partial [Candidatus Helarchaeota archaeon]
MVVQIRKFTVNRIHIAFQAFEVERISDPIIRIRADKAYIFIYKDEKTEKFMKQYYKIEKQLQDHGIQVVRNGIDLLDYFEVIQSISKIIKEERDNNPATEILINLSVGTNIT